MSGNLFVVSAPSGAGKTSLVNALLGINKRIDLSVSYTSRAARPGEVDGKDYHFVSRDAFLSMAKHGDFVESAEVYGNLYGTSQSWISKEIHDGRDILLEIDWQGAAQVRQLMPAAISIFILPPSFEALLQRLNSRAQDAPEVIAQRLANARDEISHVGEFDYVIINGEFGVAANELQAVVRAERLRTAHQLLRHSVLMNRLI